MNATMPMPVRLRSKWLVVAAAALAVGATSVLLTINVGGTHENTAAPSAKESRYVKEMSALTPAQIAAGFGTEAVVSKPPSAKEQRYVKAISSLTPAEQAAAFGTGPSSASQLAARERRYVKGITSLTPAQRAAAFGTAH